VILGLLLLIVGALSALCSVFLLFAFEYGDPTEGDRTR